ncbi:hypothetical protein BGW80DRAFT_1444587 [Lactifluus volemus]|nr:hypothetical protein BGW80DRAFT_1444587 [Lactifluus volemus]
MNRLFKFLSILSLLFGARASFLTARLPVPHRLDVRQVSNVCANINEQFPFPGSSTVAFTVDTCLCVADIPTYIGNTVSPNVLQVFGDLSSGIFQTLTDQINAAAASQNCQYPENSTPSCIDQNPCGFQCENGFTPFPCSNPTSCVCQTPSVVCNGQCVAAGACPSGSPSSGSDSGSGGEAPSGRKKRWIGSGICAEMGPEWTACGVFGSGDRAWECVNTARDLESCGGCMLPLTPYTPIGEDCSSLPGVADVACIAGQCVVQRCLLGYAGGHGRNRCVPRRRKNSQHPGDKDKAEFAPARVYGLENVPLEKY